MSNLFKHILVVAVLLGGISCNTSDTGADNIKMVKITDAAENSYDSTVLEPLYKRMSAGGSPSAAEINRYSLDVLTRAEFYTLLSEFGKASLFPKEYLTFHKAAESILAGWLTYPTELDTVPSQMEVLKKVSFVENDRTYNYYVLQFRTEEPHWAAKDGWMTGVVGPYFLDSKPYDWSGGTFSRFTKVSETTPEEEVAWVHQNVFKRGSE